MFNPIKAADKIKRDYIRYLKTSFHTKDKGVNDQFASILEEKITRGPYVEISDSFLLGKSLSQLIEEGIASPLFADLEKGKPTNYRRVLPLHRSLFKHQENALVKASEGRSLVITTGTGSGKTESFFLPLLNELLREKAKGELKDGVHALLIYPMNALANDQIKRIREILMYYPDISFGVYTGDTEEKESKGRDLYKQQHSDSQYEELRRPLPNEMVSREQIKRKPPHLLITNYVMLEYLLLRPADNWIFQTSDLKFIILDEAHVYRGAAGMESAALYKKLLGRTASHPQFILTSATLGKRGESESDIAAFASSLTSTPFQSNDIIYGERRNTKTEKSAFVPEEIWSELVDAKREDYERIFVKHGQKYDDAITPEENLYQLCALSNLYHRLRQVYRHPIEISHLVKELNETEQRVFDFLQVCSLTADGGFPLIDVRYHFFVRALEGAYLSLGKHHKLYLDKKSEDENGGSVFEIARCTRCADLAIMGRIKSDGEGRKTLDFPIESAYRQPNNESAFSYYRIVDGEDETENDPDDSIESVDLTGDFEIEDEQKEALPPKNQKTYWLCPHCRAISEVNDGKPRCGHPETDMVKIENSKNSNCPHCSKGKYAGFYVGLDGATSVLGQALFESLPSKTVLRDIRVKDGGTKKRLVEIGKQFICFSDSRSAAAYFACYEDQTYTTIIARRQLTKYLESIKDNLIKHPIDYASLDYHAKELAAFFKDKRSFIETVGEDYTNADDEAITMNMAWMILLDQLVGSDRKNFLQPMGIFKYVYLGIDGKMMQDIRKKFGISISDERLYNLLSELAFSFPSSGAVQWEDKKLDPVTSDYVFRSGVQATMVKQKALKNSINVKSFLAQNREGKSDEFYPNKRARLVMNALSINANAANDFLGYVFDQYFTNQQRPYHAVPARKSDGFVMPTSAFAIAVKGMKEAKWYQCDICGKISLFDSDGRCNVKNCPGHLRPIESPENSFKDNYYYQIYHGDYPRKLIIKEHTAQLSRKTGSNYQNAFTSGAINALSCSTTFEMGVDLGSLQTVFLRDIPPTPANYIQRAGRAGRSKDSAAFALTYAKLSSHDFHYFENPLDMIEGRIQPPIVKTDNEKILYRHVNSVVIGYFLREKCYDEKITLLDFFVQNNGKMYEEFCDLIRQKYNSLVNLLARSFNAEAIQRFHISDYDASFKSGWTEALLGDSGNLTGARDEFLANEQSLKSLYQEKASAALEMDMADIESMKKIHLKYQAYVHKKFIDFLVDKNILPKYGFPVDTVELETDDPDITLSRDLSRAIGDYAPGATVIANGKQYRSRYIKPIYRHGEAALSDGYLVFCHECHSPNFFLTKEEIRTCRYCGHALDPINAFDSIQPTNGMKAEPAGPHLKNARINLTKPQRSYTSDYYYCGKHGEDSVKQFSIGDEEITIITTENDKIMVTTNENDPFYVCPSCGYALSKNDQVKEKKVKNAILTGAPTVVKSHCDANGKNCQCTILERRILTHSFNTDIIQLAFNNRYLTRDDAESKKYSVLYALLAASAKALDIEESDIAGCCLPATEYGSNVRFVFFDTAAGGAGNVKRIADKLPEIIELACAKMEKCHCDSACYSCLKNYANQLHHEQLNRKLALDFLSPYRGKALKPLDGEIINTAVPITFQSDILEMPLRQALILVSGKMAGNICSMLLKANIPDPDFIDANIPELHSRALLVWADKKVLLFADGQQDKAKDAERRTDYKIAYADDSFDINQFLSYFQ